MTPEQFHITDNATGKNTTIRECTDEQLKRYVNEFTVRRDQLNQHLNDTLTQSMQAATVVQILLYELDRRSRSIIIPREFPRLVP